MGMNFGGGGKMGMVDMAQSMGSKTQTISREVDKIFTKICQSIELYKTENIPIITEFLEFWPGFWGFGVLGFWGND